MFSLAHTVQTPLCACAQPPLDFGCCSIYIYINHSLHLDGHICVVGRGSDVHGRAINTFIYLFIRIAHTIIIVIRVSNILADEQGQFGVGMNV